MNEHLIEELARSIHSDRSLFMSELFDYGAFRNAPRELVEDAWCKILPYDHQPETYKEFLRNEAKHQLTRVQKLLAKHSKSQDQPYMGQCH
jgi:hypothetical protein